MATQTESKTFIYETYIRTTPQKLWKALTDPDFIRRYWLGMTQETDWSRGSSWKLVFPDGKIADSGEIVEIRPPHRLVIKWRNEWDRAMRAQGFTRCTYDIKPQQGGFVKLTVIHEAGRPHKLIKAVSGGWPVILSNLKSLLETGRKLPFKNY